MFSVLIALIPSITLLNEWQAAEYVLIRRNNDLVDWYQGVFLVLHTHRKSAAFILTHVPHLVGGKKSNFHRTLSFSLKSEQSVCCFYSFHP